MNLATRIVAVVFALSGCDSAVEPPLVPPSACPAGAEEGEADFLPLKASDVWTFEYSATSYVTMAGSPRTAESGTLTLTLSDPVCTEGTRTVEAIAHRMGIRTSSYTQANGVIVRDTVALDEARNVSLVETTEGVRLPWSSGIVARYHPASTDTARVPAGPYGPVCGPGAATATLTPMGLVGFAGACNHVGSGRSLRLVRSGGT